MQIQKERVNDMIRISPVRVIGPNEEAYGVLDTIEAKRMAREAGLDLVEVSPHSRPPVCRIMDYGKYKYDQSKKQRKQRAGSSKSELKEVRLGRSMRIAKAAIPACRRSTPPLIRTPGRCTVLPATPRPSSVATTAISRARFSRR